MSNFVISPLANIHHGRVTTGIRGWFIVKVTLYLNEDVTILNKARFDSTAAHGTVYVLKKSKTVLGLFRSDDGEWVVMAKAKVEKFI